MLPIISETDYKKLGQAVVEKQSHETTLLKKLLKKLHIVKDQDVSKKTIRLNSIVILWHSLLRKIVRFRIVLPHKADLKSRNISVLTPIGMALIGHKENDSLTVAVPGIEKEFTVLRVTND